MSETVTIYSLEDLKQMTKAQIFELDMRTLPLSKELQKHFEKCGNKGHTETVYQWVFGNTRYESHMHRLVIKEFLAQLGITPHDVFTTDVLTGKSKEEIMELPIEVLCFPDRKHMEMLIEKYFEVKGAASQDLLAIATLKNLLELDILPVRVRGLGEKKLFDIRNHILRLGFEKGEYPFLAAKYWDERTTKHEEYLNTVKQELQTMYNCTEAEADKIIHIAKEYEWLPTYHQP